MNRSIKAFFLCLLSTNMSLLYAGSMGQEMPYTYDYGYLGGNIGILGLADKESSLMPSPSSHRLSATGILGGGFVGYAKTLTDRIFIDIEGFANGVSANATAIQNYGTRPEYQVDLAYNLGVRLLPGYLITPHLQGYLNIGYSAAQFQIQDNGNYGYVNDTFFENGLQAGLGVKTELSAPLSLRFDLIYSYYGLQTTYGRTTSGYQVYQNNLSTLEADLALVYAFSF